MLLFTISSSNSIQQVFLSIIQQRLCYNRYLFEPIKNGPKKDHGICFESPSAISPSLLKSKLKNIEDASKSVAKRLSTRKNNDTILFSYNSRKHWVLAVLDMKTTTCYYLDSMRPININP